MEALQSISTIELVEEISNGRRPKTYHPRSDPFRILPDVEFIRRYRFKKESMAAIINLIRVDLVTDPRGCSISPELQVLTAIRCWSRREVQDDAAELHGLSQPTVSRICVRVARALARHSVTYIKMPSTVAEQEAVIRDFAQIRDFPYVVGCIDCTHIRIRKHGGDAAQYYINRKGFYSLNVQVTCDSRLRILDVVARWRGSTHDSRIFNESSLKERFQRGEFRGRLLGDSGYKLEPYLFTPILRPQNMGEQRYNEAHIATRNTVERCFGVWKQRFQMTVRFLNVKTTIVALAVLHNIAIQEGDDSIPDHELDDSVLSQSRESPVAESTGSGRGHNSALLRAFIHRHFD